ncbi:MAG: hypothetical protein CMP48_25875 [Rickettsiales bacterium]|nr:hypothetical protein [Rickettsiales bacterium]
MKGIVIALIVLGTMMASCSDPYDEISTRVDQEVKLDGGTDGGGDDGSGGGSGGSGSEDPG